ncbi:unnamed protein product, partial [Discosporangium mesarthrocarpum]
QDWHLAITETVKAKSRGKNRAAGDMEIKPITMDGEQYKRIMIKEVIPGIKARGPGASTRTIWVKQDSAKPHAKNVLIAAIEAVARGNIILETQPLNSPDLNLLDLGFFHSIQ